MCTGFPPKYAKWNICGCAGKPVTFFLRSTQSEIKMCEFLTSLKNLAVPWLATFGSVIIVERRLHKMSNNDSVIVFKLLLVFQGISYSCCSQFKVLVKLLLIHVLGHQLLLLCVCHQFCCYLHMFQDISQVFACTVFRHLLLTYCFYMLQGVCY